MRVDPEHLARIQAHAARIQASQEYKAETKKLRRRVPSKRTRRSHAEWVRGMWERKIDRINAMGKWGWS